MKLQYSLLEWHGNDPVYRHGRGNAVESVLCVHFQSYGIRKKRTFQPKNSFPLKLSANFILPVSLVSQLIRGFRQDLGSWRHSLLIRVWSLQSLIPFTGSLTSYFPWHVNNPNACTMLYAAELLSQKLRNQPEVILNITSSKGIFSLALLTSACSGEGMKKETHFYSQGQ